VPAVLADDPGKVRFGPGFEMRSDDDEWVMQFHNLTQFDFRGYIQGGQNPTHDTFLIPREWWMWNGHLTKEIGYFVSMAQGIDTLNALDVFVDFNYDRRLQIRAGRFKTPFTYEFFVEPIQGLIIPERSLFFNNFGLNRDEGIMAYGQLFSNDQDVSKIQYAAGIFNGSRNGFISPMDGKVFAGFLTFHPFGDFQGSVLENFNFGGSVLSGNNSVNPAVPATLRTVQAISGNAAAGIPFLTLNDKAGQNGPMAFWDMHLAWFYRQLAIISEWQSGYQDYALDTSAASRSMHTRVPVGSFYVEAGYLLTGETRSQVGIVKPNRPFNLRPGQSGPGAWEVFGRYDYMDVGNQIFTNGLASTDGSANRLWMTDIGLTWHMTQYVKMFFDWNHVEFNNPVTFNVATHQKFTTSNTLWWRLQFFF
jgi:phosphate-selective porin OprO and OprP